MAVSPAPDQLVTGRVASVNPNGIKLDGESEWRNFSKYAEDIVPPMRGQCVAVTLDRQGFVRAVDAASGSEAIPTSRTAAGPDLRELRIIRQSCLRTAVERAVGRPDTTTGDVIRIAEAFEQWVLRPYDGPENVDAF